MRAYDVIQKKRDGFKLTREEIHYIVNGFTNGDIPDYQMSAFLMAVYYKGMDKEETAILTEIMMHSGDVIDLSHFGVNCADKHSTGGVGDKTTLIVGPIAASLGIKVPKMSGRGLGHTGGTLDKLESIPGFKTALTAQEFSDTVNHCGMAVVSQTANIAPADKRIYALRDVTATVDSIPLIASSVMSKKLASGADNIVLDVTMGSGAFIKDLESARALSKTMCEIGDSFSRKTVAVITNMDAPLGYSIGNALEVKEAVALLKGKKIDDLFEVSVELAAQMVSAARGIDIDEARSLCSESIESGKAYNQFRKWIAAQGGDIRFCDDFSLLPSASITVEYKASCSGYITHMNAETVGKASAVLGAGRERYDDVIDLSAGIVLRKKTGDFCEAGETIAILHTSTVRKASAASKLIDSAIIYGETKSIELPLIFEVIR